MRQTEILRDFDPGRGVSVATLAYEYPAAYEVAEHAHGSDQLIYAIRGVMEVFCGVNMWLTRRAMRSGFRRRLVTGLICRARC